MKMKQSMVLAAAWLAFAGSARAAGAHRIAILPFVPEDASAPAPDWDVASELFSRWLGGPSLIQIDMQALTRMQDGRAPSREDLKDVAFLRRIGGKLSVDSVITGTYRQTGDQAVVSARMIEVATGKIKETRRTLTRVAAIVRDPALEARSNAVLVDGPLAQAPKQAVPEIKFDEAESVAMKDAVAAAPKPKRAPKKAAPAEFVAMRDAVSDSPCASVKARLSRMEKSILDSKSRYWALEARRGVKLGPAATAVIPDPALRKQFYAKMARWYGKKSIPALTASEADAMADVEMQAMGLARRCELN